MAEGLSLLMREVSHVCYFWSVKELVKLPRFTETKIYRLCRKNGIYVHLPITIHFGIHLNIVIALTVCDMYIKEQNCLMAIHFVLHFNNVCGSTKFYVSQKCIQNSKQCRPGKICSTKDSLSGSALSGLKLFIIMAFSYKNGDFKILFVASFCFDVNTFIFF